jgi:hypothetical protein
MNTPEENVLAAMREEQETQRKQELHRGDLAWAQQWHDGWTRCPSCGGTDFRVVDLEAEAQLRYEGHSCNSCGARWKVEFRETALVVLREDSEDDWIDLPPLSERETAATLAALRYWRLERLANAGHERDIETDFDRLQPLSDEEIDALCKRIVGLDRAVK